MPVTNWSTTPADNNASPPNGWPEGMAASAVNNTARQMMADIRSFYDNTALKDASNTFTGSPLVLSNAAPEFRLVESDAAANNQIWSAYASGEAFNLSISNDAVGVTTNWLTTNRTGTTVDSINLQATVLQYNGVEVGFRHIPFGTTSSSYNLVLSDSGKNIQHNSGGGAGDVFTIPANSSVAYEVGTVLTFTNLDSNAVSIAITTDTLTLAGTTTTGTRTLAQNGIATAVKVTSTSWLISGSGLS